MCGFEGLIFLGQDFVLRLDVYWSTFFSLRVPEGFMGEVLQDK
jgi:hypothetical protein